MKICGCNKYKSDLSSASNLFKLKLDKTLSAKTSFHLKALTLEKGTRAGSKGCKIDVDAEFYFEKTYSYLENVEVVSLQDLHSKISVGCQFYWSGLQHQLDKRFIQEKI